MLLMALSTLLAWVLNGPWLAALKSHDLTRLGTASKSLNIPK
jgi:hypothetical protein